MLRKIHPIRDGVTFLPLARSTTVESPLYASRLLKKFVCPSEHEKAARAFIGSCQTFLAIGFSGRDDDVLDLLQELPSYSRFIVVGNGDAFGIMERICCRNPAMRAKCIVTEVHGGGFASLENTSFRELVAPNQ